MSFIARCPDCRTAFRINPEQLRAADGLVRCGACLAVFAAYAHRLAIEPSAGAQDPDFTGPLAPPEVDDFVDPGQGDAPAAAADNAEAANNDADSDSLALASLDAGPLEFEVAAPRRPWRSAGLFLLNTLLLLVLVAQLAWLNREQLVASPELRPLLTWTCARVPCARLRLHNAEAFRSDRLAVNPHPEREDALRVDLQFRNTAAWEQPFPLLELRFLDLGNRLLASRRFRPEEYLPGELRRLGAMPPGRPLQVRLDILDPGPVAVNYTLSFHLP